MLPIRLGTWALECPDLPYSDNGFWNELLLLEVSYKPLWLLNGVEASSSCLGYRCELHMVIACMA